MKRIEPVIPGPSVATMGFTASRIYSDGDRYGFFSPVARIKVGESRDQLIASFGEPTRAQQTVPKFAKIGVCSYCLTLKEFAYAHRPDGRVI